MRINELAQLMTNKHLMMSTAESCTGGGISQACTSVSGSSAWFDSAYITYSNESKSRLLGVKKTTIDVFGAVSEEVATAMALGASKYSDVSVAVTGVAGPSGGSEEKPVGTVWIAWTILNQKTEAEKFWFEGDRQSIRNQTIEAAINGLISRLQE